jgi:hypothetical protein
MKINKKGIELPINFMIVIGLAVLVLIAVTFIFLRAQAGGGKAIDLNSAITECQTACSIDTTKIKAVGACDDGTCNFTASPNSRFLEFTFIIDDKPNACLNITSCDKISIIGGGNCKISDEVCCGKSSTC